MLTRLHRRQRDERGATLVIFCLILVGLLTIAGIVLDFGVARADRTQNKGAADVAVAAGMRSLELSGYPAPFRGVCGAVAYLTATHPQLAGLTTASHFTYANGDPTSTDPCAAGAPEQTQLCLANDESTWAKYEQTIGGLVVTIQSGYDPNDLSYPDETLVAGTDPGDISLGNCDHLAVMINETSQPGFGKVAYGGDLTTKIRSVGRVTIDTDSETAIALLLLERADCATVDIGGNDSYVEVLGSGQNSGIVHSDSLGTGNNCNEAILDGLHSGPPIQATSSAAPGIMAHPAPLSPFTSGIISTRTATNAIDHLDNVVAGVHRVSSIAGRYNVDKKYRPAVDTLRTEANTQVNWVASPPPQRTVPNDGTWTITGCSPSAADLAQTGKVFVNCGDFQATATFQASHIVFKGEISLSGASLKLPRAQKVYVYGKTSGGNPPVGVDLGPSSAFEVNLDTGSTCPATAPSVADTSTLVIVNGALTSGSTGILKMCQTFTFLADGGALPTSTSSPGPAPADNARNGVIRTSSTLDWTAPNVYTDHPTPADMIISPFEDLSFWTEASAHSGPSHQLSGGGSLRLKGVFFAPNANKFTITGGSGANINQDAQVIVRMLKVTGGGVLKMTANPKDSVTFPFFSEFDLVR